MGEGVVGVGVVVGVVIGVGVEVVVGEVEVG